VTIAYLGGSITAQAGGWRDQTLKYLGEQFPSTTLTQVDAAVSGTGSTLGTFRLQHDVLSHHPNLLIVEFTVNDQGGILAQHVIEGIVRQTWRQDPSTDICFVYTISSYLLPQILRGRIAASSQASENVADYYGIPSINFGVEIAIRVRAGTLVMTGANPPPASPGSPEVFSADGTHPFPQTGHVIYSDAFIRGFQAMEAMPAGRISRDKPPMDANVLDQPVVMPLIGLHTTGDWQRMQLDDPTGQMARSLPDVWASRTRGDSIEFTFTGNLFGIYGVKGPTPVTSPFRLIMIGR
jgi:lysophospholipase L1-like esterase